MGYDSRSGVISAAIITSFFAISTIYKLSTTHFGDEEHTKHEAYHREYDHKWLQKSHNTLQDEETFEEKIKSGYDHESEIHKDEKLKKIEEEEREKRALHSKKIFNKFKIIAIICAIISIITSCLAFCAASGDNTIQRRHLLLPYVVYHSLVIALALVLLVFCFIAKSFVLFAIVFINAALLGLFVGFMVIHFRRLKAQYQKIYYGFGYFHMSKNSKNNSGTN